MILNFHNDQHAKAQKSGVVSQGQSQKRPILRLNKKLTYLKRLSNPKKLKKKNIKISKNNKKEAVQPSE